jgi:transcriptional regulator with XRE-family HTH domain
MAENNQENTGFAERLKKLRTEKNLSQGDLAKLIDVHYNNISRYERGESKPTAKALKALANALGVSTDYLYDGIAEDAAIADLKDKELLAMFAEIEKFNEEDKEALKNVIDAFIKRRQLKQIAS